MVSLLITYEIELTAYQTVYDAVSARLLDAGPEDIDLRKILVHVASSLPLQTEAEAEYAALFGVMQEINPETLGGALNSMATIYLTQQNSVLAVFGHYRSKLNDK